MSDEENLDEVEGIRPRPDGTTARVVAVLDALARVPDGGVGVRQLAGQLDFSRSAVHRVLQTLSELHVARALDTGNYEAGEVFAAWGAFLTRRYDLLSLSRGVLDRLVAKAEETAYLLAYAGERLTIVASAECDRPVRYVLPIGSTPPLNRGAAGKAVLAHLPARMISGLGLSPEEEKTLELDLEGTRERGYAISMGESIPDACGFAAAYFKDGVLAGSITITVPKYRVADDAHERFGPLVRDAAQELTSLLAAE